MLDVMQFHVEAELPIPPPPDNTILIVSIVCGIFGGILLVVGVVVIVMFGLKKRKKNARRRLEHTPSRLSKLQLNQSDALTDVALTPVKEAVIGTGHFSI
jgi:hypothetical protein